MAHRGRQAVPSDVLGMFVERVSDCAGKFLHLFGVISDVVRTLWGDLYRTLVLWDPYIFVILGRETQEAPELQNNDGPVSLAKPLE